MRPLAKPDFTIRNTADVPELLIYDEIGPWWLGMIDGKVIADALRSLGSVPEIGVRINSPGGDVFEGLAIYNQLSKHAAKIRIEIDGLAASIASIIAMAGDRIRIAENAMLMIHDPWTITVGGTAEHTKAAEILAKIKTESLVPTYAARTGLDAEELATLLSDETWLSASEAVEKGFADELVPNKGVSAKRIDPRIHNFRRTPEALKAAEGDDPPRRRNSAARRLELMSR
jgi:ATP-dependent protease ClpP protease subunit